jgi:hypothetical protein
MPDLDVLEHIDDRGDAGHAAPLFPNFTDLQRCVVAMPFRTKMHGTCRALLKLMRTHNKISSDSRKILHILSELQIAYVEKQSHF